MSFALPQYIERLSDPSIQSVFITGCGGGFDFVHSLSLYPELLRMGKKVVIGSYSFGDPQLIRRAPIVWRTQDPMRSDKIIEARLVDARCEGDEHYRPEVTMCRCLDAEYPAAAPHKVYAYYARSFTVPMLKDLWGKIFAEHNVDAIILMDGGSDSLMRGDENGLGDPIEDAVSVAACATFENPAIKLRMLITIGLGCDRFNGVSDASSLRAIAELTTIGGFLGCTSIHAGTPLHDFYSRCLRSMQEVQSFRSVISNSIIAAGTGSYGYDIPAELKSRLQGRNDTLYLWPLMSMHWAFDAIAVFERSLIAKRIVAKQTVNDMYEELLKIREELPTKGIEAFPPTPNPLSSSPRRPRISALAKKCASVFV